MILAGGFTILLEYLDSAVHQVMSNPEKRRFLIGIPMGTTAIAHSYSWGQAIWRTHEPNALAIGQDQRKMQYFTFCFSA